jgi:HD-GYP domain-containing protein (c-di-GMP phosphodiesterase class II)
MKNIGNFRPTGEKRFPHPLRNRVDVADSMVLIGIALAACYWGLEALINVFSPDEINFYREVFGPNVSSIWLSIIVLCLFLIFGSHVRFTINNRRKAEQALKASEEKLQNVRAATILGLAKLAEYRDKGTGLHLERIREYARIITEELAGLPQYRSVIDQQYIDDIFQSSILHDIGKVGVPDAVLLKPNELTAEEFEVVKRHATLGGDAIKVIESQIEGRSFLFLGREIAYHHHEKWDGTGYPCGLKSNQIPLSARIVALADVYDALTTKRFYKDAFTHDTAVEIIAGMRGTHFDPDVVDAFLKHAEPFRRICEEKMREDIYPENYLSAEDHGHRSGPVDVAKRRSSSSR